MSLADLCEIHWCGTPGMVLPRLDQSVGIEDVIVDDPNEPGSVLVNVDNEGMVTIRQLSTNWGLAVRFRDWLIETVFSTSPHWEHDQALTAKLARFRAYAKAHGIMSSPGNNDTAEECLGRRWRGAEGTRACSSWCGASRPVRCTDDTNPARD